MADENVNENENETETETKLQPGEQKRSASGPVDLTKYMERARKGA